jgi:hypothetical protein
MTSRMSASVRLSRTHAGWWRSNCLHMSVSTAPGKMALTRTPCGPNSAASAWVSPIRPDLLAA